EGVKLPLSFAQRRLWFLHELDPNEVAYNIPLALRLKGDLDIEALQKSFNTIVNRHEALRTVFKSKDGEPEQVIQPPCHRSIEVISLNTNTHDLDQMIQDESSKPFDLENGPLIRIKLIQVKYQGEYLLLLNMHHIISDGWSMGVFVRELTELYNAYRRGVEPDLDPLPIQYADFSYWQRTWLEERLENQASYWKEQLKDLPILDLPTDFPRVSNRGAVGE
ncbi:condensation domain-containing protein, partial [Halomonas sp. THAF12]|uniref:condensation domain-containing protein n=1 Tax=Halomonas sp. B23F22_10 TaxID=3459515 RepID=UPI00373F3635